MVPQRYGRQGEGGGRGLVFWKSAQGSAGSCGGIRTRSRARSRWLPPAGIPAVSDRVGRSEVGIALTNARRVVEAKSLDFSSKAKLA